METLSDTKKLKDLAFHQDIMQKSIHANKESCEEKFQLYSVKKRLIVSVWQGDGEHEHNQVLRF